MFLLMSASENMVRDSGSFQYQPSTTSLEVDVTSFHPMSVSDNKVRYTDVIRFLPMFLFLRVEGQMTQGSF